LPALYSTGGKVTDLRNLVLIGYNSCIHGGYNIYHNRLGFVDHQVVSACSARIASGSEIRVALFDELGHLVLARPMLSHEDIRVYTPTVAFDHVV
jgi:hypothetical protein